MQSNRGRDTKPELAVRRLLHAKGLRYRVDEQLIPGLRRRTDIAFATERIAVLIDGCYWHGCPEHGPRTFGTNAAYWTKKIAENRVRDLDTTARFEAAGWLVMRFWTHTPPGEIAEAISAAVMQERAASRRRTR